MYLKQKNRKTTSPPGKRKEGHKRSLDPTQSRNWPLQLLTSPISCGKERLKAGDGEVLHFQASPDEVPEVGMKKPSRMFPPQRPCKS